MDNQRINPDSLLKRVQEEGQDKKQGQLKIYLGAAPGVGKTYAMLKDANEKRSLGLDVVVGIVESHGRTDIEDLLIGLEILPKKNCEYKGKEFAEFDLDGALKRSPGLILIDEMAHSNIAGQRHAKRWQDIKELLDRGIDVYTTLNVQHIESLNNDVSGIIHAPIKETVPDSMLELASTIELVDLPPDDLLKRLQDGKVYFPAQAEIAKERFFRKGNLIALRELALRTTAERVGAEVLLYRQGRGIQHIWSSNEKILVCVGPGPESLQLIRAARRLATALQASWLAVYVDSQLVRENNEIKNKAIKNLRVAEQLGAETTILAGIDLVKEILGYAREQNVTLIMVWKKIRPRWQELFHNNLADAITRKSEEINIYIITGSLKQEKTEINLWPIHKLPVRYLYLFAFAMVMLATVFSFIFYKIISVQSLSLIYLVAVMLVSIMGRIGPAIFAGILSIITYKWFFLSAVFGLSVANIEYFSILLVMIILVQVISNLTFITRRQAEAARVSARKATALHRLSRQLASARGVDVLLQIGARYIAEFFNSEVMVLLPDDTGQLIIKARVNTAKELDAKDLGVAQWVYDLGQIAGLGTDTLTQADAVYIPLLASKDSSGVLRIKPRQPELLLTPDQMHFLEICANQIALTMEVDSLQEQNKKVEMEQQIDRTRNVLLQSVSQDLRIPLSAIMLAASTQIQSAKSLNGDKVFLLGETIYNEAEQLNRLINNILQITYLESNAIQLQKHIASLKNLLTKVIKLSKEKLGSTPIYISIPIDLPDVAFDEALLEAVVLNLLDNAIKFAPKDKTIEIIVIKSEKYVLVSVEDSGSGIYDQEKNKLFDKFYRGNVLETKRGLGLGLTICRMIIEAHGGKIWAENRPAGGAAFKFTLPL